MAGSLNRVSLIGHLGADPEVRALGNGNKVVNIRLATTESWKDKTTGEKKEKTEWHRIVIFNEGLATVAEKYLRKGAKVLLEGQLQTRKWEKDGVDQYSTEIVLQNFGGQLIMLSDNRDADDRGGDTRPAAGARPAASRPAVAPAFQSGGMDDDIPF